VYVVLHGRKQATRQFAEQEQIKKEESCTESQNHGSRKEVDPTKPIQQKSASGSEEETRVEACLEGNS